MASEMEAQRQLLSLIRDFAAEKSQGERRVSDLRKRLLELQADSDAANSDLEGAKRAREAAERELRASQLHLSMTDSSILALESRISLLQEEISKLGSDLAALKNVEGIQRDGFINTMFEFNTKIRQFQKVTSNALQNQCPFPSDDGKRKMDKEEVDMKDTLKGIEHDIINIDARLHQVEREYNEELHDHDEICQELANSKKRWFLVETVMEETRQLQELGGQTSESEKTYAALGAELQRRYICPSCHFNNMGDLEAISQT